MIGLITFKCCYRNKLLTAKATFWIASETLSSITIILSFSLLWMTFVPIISFRLYSFSKGYNRSVLKGFSTNFLCLNMCYCFVRILLDLVTFDYMLLKWHTLFILTLLLVEQFFSNLLYGIFFVSFINKLFIRLSRVTVVVLECWAYSSNSKCLAITDTCL